MSSIELKQTTNRIHGTSTTLSDSYMMEAILDKKARARGEYLFDAFVKLLHENYKFE